MQEPRTVRLRVSPEAARVVSKESPRDLQLAAARGELQIGTHDLLVALLFFTHGGDPELRRLSLSTLRNLPVPAVLGAVTDPKTPPQLLDFLARVRGHEPEIMQALLAAGPISPAVLARVAATAEAPVLELIRRSPLAASPEVAAALAGHPSAGNLGGDPGLERRGGETEDEEDEESGPGEEEGEPLEEEIDASKYKLAMQMEVSEKIKTAMTGDKEWRTLFVKDPNKLVSSAVLKNPRITEGEVLAVAKNKSAHDELIRLILVNREWLKNYQILRALILHPKTPVPKALRYMDILTLKDIKAIAKSRNVSPVLVNNARRILVARNKKR